jgi:branched-chain amino acid transport system permease protein
MSGFGVALLLEQALNGFQFGVMLFLMAAGLTLVFGIMHLINLAHGSLYMIGAYVCAVVFTASGSFFIGLAAALAAAMVIGAMIEIGIFRILYARPHVDQVLATFAIVLFFNHLVRAIWGPTALNARVPSFLAGQVNILPGSPYPAYRLAIIGIGLAVALGLYLLISRTRTGMLIRASAANRTMANALGVNIPLLYTLVFVLGAALAALSGAMAGPLFTVQSGMGDGILILAFVVIVIGGMGSIRGAFIAALLVGIVDTMGRAFLRPFFALFLTRTAADNTGPALASMLIYILMAAVLFFRPQGLFPPRMR